MYGSTSTNSWLNTISRSKKRADSGEAQTLQHSGDRLIQCIAYDSHLTPHKQPDTDEDNYK